MDTPPPTIDPLPLTRILEAARESGVSYIEADLPDVDSPDPLRIRARFDQTRDDRPVHWPGDFVVQASAVPQLADALGYAATLLIPGTQREVLLKWAGLMRP